MVFEYLSCHQESVSCEEYDAERVHGCTDEQHIHINLVQSATYGSPIESRREPGVYAYLLNGLLAYLTVHSSASLAATWTMCAR